MFTGWLIVDLIAKPVEAFCPPQSGNLTKLDLIFFSLCLQDPQTLALLPDFARKLTIFLITGLVLWKRHVYLLLQSIIALIKIRAYGS